MRKRIFLICGTTFVLFLTAFLVSLWQNNVSASALNPPIALSPCQNEKDVSLTPTLDWDPPAGGYNLPSGYTLKYRWQIDSGVALVDYGDVSAPATKAEISSGTLQPGLTYSWKVKALRYVKEAPDLPVRLYDESGWSNVCNFTTGELTAPKLSAPVEYESAVLTPTLKWFLVKVAKKYQWEVWKKKVDTGKKVDSGEVDITQATTKKLEEATRYEWRVRACTIDKNLEIKECSGWSASWFKTLLIQTADEFQAIEPKLISPGNGAKNVPLSATLKWEPVEGAEEYKYRILPDIGIKSLDAPQVEITLDLKKEITYIWKVRAFRVDKNTENLINTQWSKEWSFTTTPSEEPPPEVPLTPTPTPTPTPGVKIKTGLVCPSQMKDCPSGAVCIPNPLCADTLEELLSAITNFIRNLASVVAPIMLVISGLLFVTSAGDPGRVQIAKKLALYTVIGFAIILVASGLVSVLKSIIGVQPKP